VINYTQHRAAIETLYEDRAIISRYLETEELSGETKLSVNPVPVYTDQPCKLSQSGLSKNNQTEAQNDIGYEAKLFIAPEILIHQGDIIEITRAVNGSKWTYTAGEPFPPYWSHQEVNLERRGYA
jgi:hypothetical protein